MTIIYYLIKNRPRLGPTMHKVVGIGGLYFIFALVDGVFRIIEVNMLISKIKIQENAH